MYVKLFASILDSSVWAEPVAVRVVWVAMLAMADRDGFVRASPTGLARRANVDPKSCHDSVATLEAPDPESSSQEWDGRRVERVAGGWQILNYAAYRTLADADIRRQQVKEAVRRHRARKASVIISNPESITESRHHHDTNVSQCKQPYPQAEAEAEAEANSNYKNSEPDGSPTFSLAIPETTPAEPAEPDPIGTLMPLVRTHLYLGPKPPSGYQEGRDVTILRALLRHRSVPELMSAIQGIATLRDSGALKALGPQFYPRKPMTLRVLYNTKVLVRGDDSLRWAMDAAIRESLDTL